MKKIILLILLFSWFSSQSQTLQPIMSHTEEGRFEMTNFIVKDTLLIWPQGENGLNIYSIANLDSLKIIAHYEDFEVRSRKDIYGKAYNTVLRNDTLFLCYGDLGLKILDISDPEIPVELGSYYRHHEVYSLTLFQNYAFLGLADLGLEIVNFTDIKDIKMVGRNNLKDFPAQNIIVRPPYTMVTGGKRGIKIFKFKDPFTDYKWAQYPKNFYPENDANKLIIDGKYGYLANDFKGLTVLNLTLPEYPMEHTTIKTSGRAQDLLLNGNKLYVASGGCIYTFDITDPKEPVIVSTFESKSKDFYSLFLERGNLWATFKDGYRDFGIMKFDILIE